MAKKGIQPGYQLHVESWENDGDNSKTEITSGLNETDCRFLIFLAASFGWNVAGGSKMDHVFGNDENTNHGFWLLYKEALETYPGVSDKYKVAMPTEADILMYDEFSELRYNDPAKGDPKYATVQGYNNITVHFLDFFNNLICSLLGYPGEGYDDFSNFHRVCDSIKVFYVPGEIEDVTKQFIN